MPTTLRPSINSSTIALLESRLVDAERLGLLRTDIAGASVIQFAANKVGTMEAGVLLAKSCLGGQAEVSVVDPTSNQISLPHIAVATSNPLADCIGCQYAGWPLNVDDYSAMASGPIRLLRGSESILEQYDLRLSEPKAMIVLESHKLPTESAIAHIAQQAGIATQDLFICIANTSSLPGSLQVVARSVETAMHKLHEIGFDLETVQYGQGTAPLPPMTDSDLTAMGWTNDAMLYLSLIHISEPTRPY